MIELYKTCNTCEDLLPFYEFNRRGGKHPQALDFDHLPGFPKTRDVSQMVYANKWEPIEAEIAKCEVVCANCHRVRTESRRSDVYAYRT